MAYGRRRFSGGYRRRAFKPYYSKRRYRAGFKSSAKKKKTYVANAAKVISYIRAMAAANGKKI